MTILILLGLLAALLVLAGVLLIVLGWEKHHDHIDPAGTARRLAGAGRRPAYRTWLGETP
ncbi:hypothetical protein ACEUBT_00180 [Aeromonas bivalvium]|uniref:hypothetical protein n=1 Tax=Aeromonas bivalvium TaxID=440079 RepID=UPI0038D10511